MTPVITLFHVVHVQITLKIKTILNIVLMIYVSITRLSILKEDVIFALLGWFMIPPNNFVSQL